MEKVVPAHKWIKALGKKGTIIFADTKGYHKGGRALDSEKIMYNCLFVSPASKTAEVFLREKKSEAALPDKEFSYPQKFAYASFKGNQ